MADIDIAQIVKEHENRPPADAMAWAERFVEYAQWYPAIATDAGAMAGWFANVLQNAELPPHPVVPLPDMEA